MAKANPKAWFTSPIAKITYRSVDKWARHNQRWRPFFPTWGEAHNWMEGEAKARVAKAERELASARRSLDKIVRMVEPAKSNVAVGGEP